MNKKDFEELKNDLEARMNGISIDFCENYDIADRHYISDLFTEQADGYVDIYNADLLEWAKHNYEYIEEAIDEFGDVAKDSQGRADFMRTIQQGEFLYYERQLYEDEDNIIELLAVNYILENMNENKEYGEWDGIDVDVNDTTDDIKDICDEYLGKEETE